MALVGFIVLKRMYNIKSKNKEKNVTFYMINFCPILSLSMKFDNILSKFNISIPYPILALLYAYPVYNAAMVY